MAIQVEDNLSCSFIVYRSCEGKSRIRGVALEMHTNVLGELKRGASVR